MRQRRKKHLEERLDGCGELLLQLRSTERRHDAPDDGSQRLDLAALFGGEGAVHLEIGCGRGSFVCEMARRCPDVRFLAVEKNRSVLLDACKAAAAQGLSNIRFLAVEAEYLPRFIPPRAVSRIYLNFSCPHPKVRDAVHRLTHVRFLEMYKTLLAPGGDIHQKTDNRGLFEFSIEQFSAAGYRLQNVSLDLHRSDFEGNIPTEYEQKFAALGMPIYRLEAVPNI